MQRRWRTRCSMARAKYSGWLNGPLERWPGRHCQRCGQTYCKRREPVAMLYMQQHLQKRATGPAARELLTLAMAVDLMLKSRPAKALDVLLRRMKAVEAGLMGSHWSATQRLEVGPSDQLCMTGQEELVSAQRAAHSEARTRLLASYPEGRPKGGKSEDKSKDEPREGQRKRRERQGQAAPEGGPGEQVNTPGDGSSMSWRSTRQYLIQSYHQS